MNKPIFSTKVASNSRDYFFDVKQSKNGHYYLVINESKKSDSDDKRQCILVFNNLLNEFSAAFAQCMQRISELDKTVVWDPRQTMSDISRSHTQNDTHHRVKRRFRDLSTDEIKRQQDLNVKTGKPKNSGLRWSENDRKLVLKKFEQGDSIAVIAENLNRSIASITAELKKQGINLDNASKLKPF